MKKNPESILKKSVRSIAASFPVAASLSQWWSEMDSDTQTEAIEDLQDKISTLQNPIPFSHLKAPEALKFIFKMIEETNYNDWETNDNFKPFYEVFNLWEKKGYLEGQHPIGYRWRSVRLTNPYFTIAVYAAVKGDKSVLELRQAVWQYVQNEGKGVRGEPIADKLNVNLVFIDCLFQIFEEEGKGWKSKTVGETFFSPVPELC